MSYRMVMTLALSVSFIGACSSQSEPPKKTVLEPMTQQVQRAKEVQGIADAQAESTRKAVDAQERGDDR